MIELLLIVILSVAMVWFIVLLIREQSHHAEALKQLEEADILILALQMEDDKEKRNELADKYIFNYTTWK